MGSAQFCKGCGQELRPGARFCPECGRPLAVPGQQDTPGSTDFPSPAAPAPADAGYPETAPPPASPGYTPAAAWSATAASEPVPAPAHDSAPPPSSAADAGRATQAWQPSAADPATAEWRPSAPSGTPPLQPDSGPEADLSGQNPHAAAPKRSRWPLLAAIIAVVVLGAGAGIALAVLPSHHRPAGNADKAHHGVAVRQSSPTAGQSSSSASSPALPPSQQAAEALAALLAQSGTDRAAVTQAVSAVADCSPDLSQDETVFSNAATSHQALLGKLAALPDRSALPASMLRDLTTAWQASGQADQDFAKWTQDEISQGCSTSSDQSDASYQAATVPDGQATQYKKTFATLWAPIADQYGLPLYQYNQI